MVAISDYFKNLPDIAAAHAMSYLVNELSLTPKQHDRSACQDSLVLEDHSITAFMALGGKLPVLVALNVSQTLSRYTFGVSTAGLVIAENERDMMEKEVVADMINVILGNGMDELDQLGETIRLSPPVVIHAESQQLLRRKDACFSSVHIDTEHGAMRLLFIAPHTAIDPKTLVSQ